MTCKLYCMWHTVEFLSNIIGGRVSLLRFDSRMSEAI